MRQLEDNPDENHAWIPRTTAANDKLAIFIHGFEGNYLGTWGRLPDLLAKHADDEQPFADWDYLFAGYGSGRVDTFLDIAHIICSRWKDAASGAVPHGQSYKSLALIGHSLGTLGIRQALCAWSVQPPGMQAAIKSVTLFGPPLNGSELAKYAVWRTISEALKPGNPQLRMLREWSTGSFARQPWPVAEVIVGLDDDVVGYQQQDLVDWPGDNQPVTTLDIGHRAMVKPNDWKKSSAVNYLRRALK